MGHLLMCLGYMGFSVQWHGSKVHPQGWKPTLVTQAFSDSSLWRRGTPTYMGMGDNLSKSKGIITAPPNVFDNIHKDMQLSSEQWHKLPVSWIGQRLFQLVLTNERQSLGTPSFHSLWCRNVWPSARRPGQQKQPRSARSLPLSLSLSFSGFCSKDLQKQADGGWECSTQNQLQTCRKEGESAFSWHPYPAAPGQRRAAIFLA